MWELFQSTRPSRGATIAAEAQTGRLHISIHAPLAGRDPVFANIGEQAIKFQSTRPSRGATADFDFCKTGMVISIHAPLAGRDPRNFMPISS